MDQWIELRRRIHNEHVSLRQLERETGIHRKTLRKIRDNRSYQGLEAVAGGLITSKPYISSSNYIRKMSDFAPGEWCDVWDARYRHTGNQIHT